MVWHAFADDSGTHDGSEFTLLVGYIGSPAQWKRIRREWRQVLGAIPEFKSTEFFQRERWRSSKSPYHGWTDAQARTFLNALLDIINRRDIWPIGGACNNTDFFKYSKPVRSWLTGASYLTITHFYEGNLEIIEKLKENEGAPERPYFIVFPGLLVDAMHFTSGRSKPKIHFYLDRQGFSEDTGLRAFNRFKANIDNPEKDNLASITYSESCEEIGIQAADLYAYTWYSHLTSKITPDLERAYEVLTRIKQRLRVTDNATYFEPLLAYGQKAIEESLQNSMDELV